MSLSFDFLAWHQSIREFAWWEDASMDYSWHLLDVTKLAHKDGSQYWLQSRTGGDPLGLTDLYEKIKIVTILKETNE